MAYALAILSTLGGALVALCMVTLIMAGAANSKPAFLAKLKMGMLSIAAVGFLGFIAAVWLMVAGLPMIATWVGAAPGVTAFVVMWSLIRYDKWQRSQDPGMTDPAWRCRR